MKTFYSLGKGERALKRRSEDNALADVDENWLQKSLMSPGGDSDQLQRAATRGTARRCAIYPLFLASQILDSLARWFAQMSESCLVMGRLPPSGHKYVRVASDILLITT